MVLSQNQSMTFPAKVKFNFPLKSNSPARNAEELTLGLPCFLPVSFVFDTQVAQEGPWASILVLACGAPLLP